MQKAIASLMAALKTTMSLMSGAPMPKFRTTNAMLTRIRDTRIFSTGCAGMTGKKASLPFGGSG